MAVRINKADEPKAVDLEHLKDGGVVIVCDTDDDWRQFIETAALRYHRWMNNNTDVFDPVMVEIMLDLGKGPNGAQVNSNVLQLDGNDLVEHVASFVELDPLDPKDFAFSYDDLVKDLSPEEKEASPIGDAYVEMLNLFEIWAEEFKVDQKADPSLRCPCGSPTKTTAPTNKDLAIRHNISMYHASLVIEAAMDEWYDDPIHGGLHTIEY
jgi:hypothetical protein